MAETEKKIKKIKLPKKIFAQNGEHKHGPISRNGHRSYGVVFLPSIAHDFIACKQERLQRLQHINQMVYLGSMEILCAQKKGWITGKSGPWFLILLLLFCAWSSKIPLIPCLHLSAQRLILLKISKPNRWRSWFSVRKLCKACCYGQHKWCIYMYFLCLNHLQVGILRILRKPIHPQTSQTAQTSATVQNPDLKIPNRIEGLGDSTAKSFWRASSESR